PPSRNGVVEPPNAPRLAPLAWPGAPPRPRDPESAHGQRPHRISFCPLAHGPAVLDHQAAVLDDHDPRPGQRLGRLVVADPGLEPRDPGPLLEEVREVRCDVAWATEHVDQIDGPWDVRDPAIHALAQDL